MDFLIFSTKVCEKRGVGMVLCRPRIGLAPVVRAAISNILYAE